MMRELLKRLLDSLTAGRAVAYCRLVETRGSTPQKAGAAMLVFADGSQAGTLGGGCVEAEVKRRALAVLEGGEPEICSFQLDNDYGWDDGLICGGRMLVLVEPIATLADADYFVRLEQALDQGQGCIEVIVFDAEKSGLPAAASFLASSGGTLLASRNAGDAQSLPAVVSDSLADAIARPRAQAISGIAYLPQRCAQNS